ncbi:hypothetical protein LEMLEM_LOCUS27049 [Lemmus lemmus]
MSLSRMKLAGEADLQRTVYLRMALNFCSSSLCLSAEISGLWDHAGNQTRGFMNGASALPTASHLQPTNPLFNLNNI